jgi:Leucine-rich repeat (LRR) protein
MQSISAVLNQFNPLVNTVTREDPERVQLLQALKTLESAVVLIEAGKVPDYQSFCSEKLRQLKLKDSQLSPSEALSDVIRAICDISLKLFSMMKKPSLPSDLDVGSSLMRDVFRLDDSSSASYRAFSEWISLHNIPVADLNWKKEELLRLAPHLSVVNLTDYAETRSGLPIHEFLSACIAAKTLIFFKNDITEPLKAAIQLLATVDTVQFKFCNFAGGFPDLSSCKSLRSLLVQESIFESSFLDFERYANLQSLNIVGLPKYNGPILFPASGSLREFRLDYLPQFDARLDFSRSSSLEHLYLNLLRLMNQPLDLYPLTKLETLVIKCCDAWEADLTLPNSCSLKILDFTDDRKFKKDLSPIKNFTSLEKITLTNCRNLESEIDFSNLSNLTHLSLRNSFSYVGSVNCLQASSLQVLDVLNCKKIGLVVPPPHLKL